MARGNYHDRYKVAILISLAISLHSMAHARWAEQADELPEWAQRGRMIFIRWDDSAPTSLPPEFEQWKPVLHLHGARYPGKHIAESDAKQIPLSLRLEAVMFFGDDRAIKKILERAHYGWREHSWCWQYNWWVRDPVFHEAALIKRDGTQLIEYTGNSVTEREMGNPLQPALVRMRREISQAVLTPHDPKDPSNPLYPKFPYTPYDDVNFGKKGEPYEYYPVFGHLSMLWYDNPNLWADASEFSQKIWRAHFKEKFGQDIADPASHPDDRVRREWTRFWAEAYGSYLDKYYQFHQENIQKAAVSATVTGLDGKRHLPVGLNASPVAKPWGAEFLYLFNRHRIASFPGLLVEYEAPFTRGKYAPMIKFSMAAMRGRQTGWSSTDQTAEAEALALNGTHAYTGLTPRAKAYIQFQFDNRALFTNAMQGNRVGVVYNVRTGLLSNTLIGAYELGQQLDELGIPYDVIVEEDLSEANRDFLRGYVALLVPGGEFNEGELHALNSYCETGGQLVCVGAVELELEKRQAPAIAGAARKYDEGNPLFADALAGKRFLDQVPTNKQIEEALAPCFSRTYRLLTPRDGFVCANVLRQPRQGDALIIGLVNYSGQIQHDVSIALPKDTKFRKAAAISPDGYAALLETKIADGVPTLTLPELYNYSALVLGESSIPDAALATVKSRVGELLAVREPLKKAAPTPLSDSFTMDNSVLKPEGIPAGQRLARLRAGTFETATYIVMDALAPRTVKANEPIRVTMHLRYSKFGTMEYWRVHAVDVVTGEEIRTKPPVAKEFIDGVGVQQLDGEKPGPMGYITDQLVGKTFVADFQIAKPGRYQVNLDYLYVNPFLHGELGPRIEPAFLGDRPDSGWEFPQKPFRKHYLKHRFPGMVIEVQP